MSNNDLYCHKCKSHHHPVECLKDTEALKPIFKKERQAFYRLWHGYHARCQIPYSHEEKELFFNSLTEIFCEDRKESK